MRKRIVAELRLTPLTLTPLTPSFFLGCHCAVTPLFSAQKTEEERSYNGVRAKEERRNVSFRRISALLIYFCRKFSMKNNVLHEKIKLRVSVTLCYTSYGI